MEENTSIITTTTTSKTYDKPISLYENGEYLFWKVFNNKYLLNFIIYKIQTSEWEYYHDHTLIYAKNRMKFKDIIHLKSFHILFKEFSILSGTKKDDEDSNKLYKRKDEKKALILKEILISLLEKKRNEFEICDLTKSAIINSIEGIKILINEPLYQCLSINHRINI
ncbi:hypothetical protein ACTFIY_008015 [Dictyostelium cf. discoideum]